MVGGAPEQVPASLHTGTKVIFFYLLTPDYINVVVAGGATDRLGGGSAESSPYFSRRHGAHKPPERYQSCMALPSEGLVEPLDRDRARAGSDDRGVGTGSSGPASPRSVNSAPCGLEEHRAGASRLGLALPLGLTHSSPTASPQRMEWKVSSVMSSGLFCRNRVTLCKSQIHLKPTRRTAD